MDPGIPAAAVRPRLRTAAWAVTERTLAAVVAGVLVGALVERGVLRGWLLLALVVGGLLLVPVARDLAGRVLLTGFLVLGWLPLTWWVPWPVPVGRVAVGSALLAACLAAVAAGGPGRRSRLSILVPRVRAVDGLLVAVAVAVGALRAPWWGARSADSALALMLAGWDHSAHFDITEMIRRHGTVMHWMEAAAFGDTWSYTRYPQGFHSLAAGVVEALVGPYLADPRAEVLGYVRALGFLDVVGAVVLTGGILALPWLRARGWLAAPAVALAVSTLTLGPGAHLLQDGFPNFTLGTALLAGLVPLVVTAARVPDPLRLAAVGGGLVGIAHSWVLLLVVALPVVLLLLLPWRAERWRAARWEWTGSVFVALVTTAAGLVAVGLVSGESLAEVLLLGGSITLPPPRWTAGLVALAGAGSLATVLRARRLRRGTDRPSRVTQDELVRVAGLGAVVLVSASLTAGVAAVQLQAGGLSYYFWKLTVAVGVVAAVVAAVSGTLLLLEGFSYRPGRRVVVATGVAAAVLITQGYGITAPVPQPLAAGPGWLVAERERAVSDAVPSPAVLDLWSAAAGTPPAGRRLVVFGTGTSPTERISLGQWYNALTGRWTDEANELLFAVTVPASSPAELASLAATVLADPANLLLVPRDQVEPTRAAFGALASSDASLDPAAVGRIVPW